MASRRNRKRARARRAKRKKSRGDPHARGPNAPRLTLESSVERKAERAERDYRKTEREMMQSPAATPRQLAPLVAASARDGARDAMSFVGWDRLLSDEFVTDEMRSDAGLIILGNPETASERRLREYRQALFRQDPREYHALTRGEFAPERPE